jgi:type III secretion protein D
MTTTKWVLKLLSGTHSGAEMYLEKRSYRLGRSDTNDIILRDETLPDHLLDIHVEAESLSLSCSGQDTTIYVDGLKHKDNSLSVTAYCVYSIGLLHFCFGESGAVWPSIKTPQYEDVKKAVKQRDVGIRKYLRSFRDSKICLNLSLVFAFALISAIFSNSKLDAGIIDTTIATDEIKQIHDLGYDGLIVEPINKNGEGYSWQIHGYVDRALDLSNLKRLLARQSINADIDVRVMEYIRKSTEVLLKQFKYAGLVVSLNDNDGELTISGVIDNLTGWDNTKYRLLADIPGLINIQDLVETQESRVELLKKWVNEENLDNDIVINAANGRLMISSELHLNDNEAWSRVKLKFEKMFNEKLDLVVMNKARPTLAIQGVSYGAFPYFITDSGRKYIQGAHVHDGFYLHKIEKQSVVLKRGDEVLKYQVGQ